MRTSRALATLRESKWMVRRCLGAVKWWALGRLGTVRAADTAAPASDVLHVEEPAPGSRAAGAVFVRGWCRTASRVLPEASIGERGLPAVLWEAPGPEDSQAVGFAGWIDLADAETGSADLTLSAGGARAALPLELAPATLNLACLHPAVMPIPSPGHIDIEALACDERGAAAEVRLEGPDLFLSAAPIGRHAGAFALVADIRQTATLVLVAYGQDGARRCLPLVRRQPAEHELDLAVERTDRHSGSLRVSGYALWPAPPPDNPRVRIELGGELLAEASATRSRPEVAWPPWGVTARCGFDVTIEDPRPELALNLSLSVVDGGGRARAIGVPVPPAPPATGPRAADVAAAARKAAGDGGVLLDWGAGVAAHAESAGLRVLVPPLETETLPYADHSVDVVVVGPEASRLGEAERVAARAVVRTSPDGAIAVRRHGPRPEPPASGPRPETHAGRALLVTHRPPDHHGLPGARHAAIDMDALLEDGWEVIVIATQVLPEDEPERRAAARRGVRVYAGPHCSNIDLDYLERPEQLIATGKFDFVSIHWRWIAHQYLPLVREAAPGTPILFEAGSLGFLLQARRAAINAEPLAAEAGSAFVDELNALAAADAIALASAHECEIARSLLGAEASVHHVPLSRPIRATPPPPFDARRGLLFVGNFDFWPNRDALDYLCEEVLPRLPAELARPVEVIGFDLDPARARRLHESGIRVVGAVPRLEPYLDRVRALVVPIRYASGVTNKVLDGLAAGTPVVTTRAGAEGLEIASGDGLLVANDAAGLARELTAVLSDSARWAELSRRGRGWIAEHCSPEREMDAWRAARDATLYAGSCTPAGRDVLQSSSAPRTPS